ncbi:MAG: hypothetical protein ACM4AI_19060 [Acidobacteriota bacterium]
MSASARAFLYSGLPDPEWMVPGDRLEVLLAMWDALERTSLPPRSTPTLGYRGVELRLEDGVTFTAADAVVTRSEQGSGEARLDSARSFESAVLATAPPGAIPSGLVKKPAT